MGRSRPRLLSVVVCLLLPLQATSVWALTLRDAVEIAVKSYPEVLAAQEYGKSLDQKVQQSLAGYLPRVDFTAGYGQEKSDNTTTRSANQLLGKSEHALSMKRGESALTVRQNLFDGFEVRSKVAQARAQLLAARARLNLVSDNVALQAAFAYTDLVLKHVQLELIKDNVLLHQRILAKVEEKFKGGVGTEADVDQAKSRTFLASANHASNLAAYKNAQTKFTELVALPALKESEMIRPQPREKWLPNSVDEALESALRSGWDMEEARLNLEAAEAGLESAKATLYPKVDLELTGSNNANLGGVVGHSNSLTSLMRMNMNLFEGGAGRARIQEQSNLVEQTRQNKDKVQRTVETSIQETWNRLTMSRERIGFLQQHFEVSKRVVASYHDQFKMGKRTLLDLLNSENELFAAKNGLLSEEFNYIKTYYELLARTGSLRNALNEEPSSPVDPQQPIENKDTLSFDRQRPVPLISTTTAVRQDALGRDDSAGVRSREVHPALVAMELDLPNEPVVNRVAHEKPASARSRIVPVSLHTPDPPTLEVDEPRQAVVHVSQKREIDALMRRANRHWQAQRLTKPKGRNALECYQRILARSPDHEGAQSGVRRITARLLDLARDDLENWRLVQPGNQNALDKLRLVLSIDANNSNAKESLDELRDRFLSLANRFTDNSRKREKFLNFAKMVTSESEKGPGFDQP
ncbi:MAG: TolC family outer membrane protein [Magnetococcus sp. YQC-9]